MQKNNTLNIINKYKIPLLFLLFVFLHIFQLGIIPHGINVDEVSLSLNAQNIIENGTDRYGNSFPLYFKNGASGQSAMATYIVALFYKLFGISLFTLRFPFVISGCIFFVFIYLISKEIFKEEGTFLSCLFITIMPYFIMVFRWSLDCNMQILFMTISLYLYLKYIKTKKKKFLILTGIFFGLTLYTYILSWVLIPLFLITTSIFCVIEKKIKTKEIILLLTIITIIGLPLIYFTLILLFDFPRIELGIFTIYPCNNVRLNEFALSNPFTNIKQGIFNTLFFTPYLGYLAYPNFFTMYIFSIPLLLYGIIVAIKEHKLIDKIMLSLLVSYIILMSLITSPNISKLNFIFVIYLYFIILGIINIKHKAVKNSIYILYSIFFILFLFFYFNKTNEDMIYFDNGVVETIEYVYEISDEKDIYIDYNSNLHIHMYMQYVIPINNNERNLYETNFGYYNNYKNFHKIQNDIIQENSIYIIGDSENLKYKFYNNESQSIIKSLFSQFLNNNYEIKKINNYYVIIT